MKAIDLEAADFQLSNMLEAAILAVSLLVSLVLVGQPWLEWNRNDDNWFEDDPL